MKLRLLLLTLVSIASGPRATAWPLTVPAHLSANSGGRVSGGKVEFDRRLQAAKKLANTRRWSQAKTELDRLLASRENESELVAHLSEVVELYRRCSFFESNPPVSIRELVGGQVTAWNERSGQIGVTYSDLSEFTDDGAGAMVHPLEFSGPYRIEVHGRMGSAPTSLSAVPRAPQILVAIRGRESVQLSFGHPQFSVENRTQWIPPRIIANGLGSAKVLDEAAVVPLQFEERFKLVIEVDASTISATVDGQLILSASKDPELFGSMAVVDIPGLTRISLRGTAHPSWTNQLQDRAREEAWRQFRETWRVEDELPSWISERLQNERSPSAPLTLPFQLRVTEAQLPTLQRVSAHLALGQFENGLREIESLSSIDLAPELQLFLKALFQLSLERKSAARKTIEHAIEQTPDFFEARLLHGRILGELGLEQETLSVFEEFVEELPSVPTAWAEYAAWCLRFGQPKAAQQVMERALSAGIPGSYLRETESLVTRALSGPLWEQTFEYSSRNFTVHSDIDRQICFDAAQELEAALRLYQMRLDRMGFATRDRARALVYIFSGRAGYDSYAGDLFSNAPEATAGLFSPALKQILVWIPPERDQLFQTLRHEGLHQFLDALLGRLPTWLNEGLAEYFENTKLIRGVSTPGQPDLHHLAILSAEGYPWIPYRELFAMPTDEFYRDSSGKYAQSWALVHWIQNADRSTAQLMQRFLKELSVGGNPAKLGESLLDIGDLDERVKEHVRKLTREL